MPRSRSRRPALVPRLARRVLAAGVGAAAAGTLALVGPAAAATGDDAPRVVTIRGTDAAGPSRYDKVTLVEHGPRDAENVLILEPGTSGGGPYFSPVAEALVDRLPGWQVWSIERRENRLEDQSMLDRARAGKATPQDLFDYYLGWIGSPDPPADHFRPKTDDETAFARDWGMKTAVRDIRFVVKRAHRYGKKVVLGGHSLGGSITTAYATWDFDGRAGVDDLDGLVYIDGASLPGSAIDPQEARERLAEIRDGSPFIDLTGLGLPWSAGVFNAVGSTSVKIAPDEPSILQRWPLLPASLKPPVPATNEGSYGYALDTETGPENLRLVQMHLGSLATTGDPRPWEDGGLVPVQRAATVFSGVRRMDGTAWYHPKRLSLDSAAVSGGVPSPTQKLLDVPARHARDVDVPLYAFTTSLGGDRVLDATKDLARRGGVAEKDVTLVDRQKTYAHIDPLAATPRKNDFVTTVVPFLRKIGDENG